MSAATERDARVREFLRSLTDEQRKQLEDAERRRIAADRAVRGNRAS